MEDPETVDPTSAEVNVKNDLLVFEMFINFAWRGEKCKRTGPFSGVWFVGLKNIGFRRFRQTVMFLKAKLPNVEPNKDLDT